MDVFNLDNWKFVYDTSPTNSNPNVTINCIPKLMFCVCVDCSSRYATTIVDKQLFILIDNTYTSINYTPRLGDYGKSNISTTTSPFTITINNNSIKVICNYRNASSSAQVCLGVLYIE